MKQQSISVLNLIYFTKYGHTINIFLHFILRAVLPSSPCTIFTKSFKLCLYGKIIFNDQYFFLHRDTSLTFYYTVSERFSQSILKKISCYIKSLFSTLYTDRIAQIKDTRVRIAGKTRLFFIVKSPMLACVRKISRKDEIIVAFDDFMARPINNVIKLMLTITTDFRMSCT